MRTTFILGAGFSIPAGFPSGHTVNEKFFSTVENKILRHSSGEWSWDEYGDATSNNGRLNFEYLKFSYLLSELVELYQKKTYQVFDYEEFYDWLNEKDNDRAFIIDVCNSVNLRLMENFNLEKDSEHYFKNPNLFALSIIKEIYNHLISDLLVRAYHKQEYKNYYSPVMNLIRDSEFCDIITLNHDILLEYLLENEKINFSDGFTKDNSVIIGEDDEKLEVFDNYYPKNVKLLKLHGSVNYNLFNEMELDGMWHRPTGKYHFYKANYRNKHYARRINPISNEVIQDFNDSIVPQFLTGKTKSKIILEHSVYSKIYEHLKFSFENTDKVIIIGYSYRDLHVNEIVKTALDKFDFEIVNINPSVQFPFRKNYSNSKITNLKFISDL